MTPLCSPDSQKENAYVAESVCNRWFVPRSLPWALVPLLGGVAFLATVDEWDYPIPIISAVAAALVGLLIARLLTARIPTWNQGRRENIQRRAREEFNSRFQSFKKEFSGVVAEVEQFQRAINAKSYWLYVERARAAQRYKRLLQHGTQPAQFDSFFDEMPNALSELQETVKSLLHEVEADPSAVTAYQPDLLNRVSSFENRMAAGNILDSYRASRELEDLFDALENRDSPFNFVEVISRLREHVYQCRDKILSDPSREAVWRDIQHKDETLRETIRTNKKREEADEAVAEAARDQAKSARQQVKLHEQHNEHIREQNELLRQQKNAQLATAAAAVGTLVYTRKAANATREMADRSSEDD